MKIKNSSSIMNRFLSLFLVSGLIISACSLTYGMISSASLRKKASAVSDSTLSAADNIIESVFADMKSCANQVAENKYTQSYLSSDSISDKITYSTILNNSIFRLTDFHTSINNISLITTNGSILAFPRKHYAIIDDLNKEYNILSSQTTAGFSKVLYEPLTNIKYVSYYEPVFQVNTGNINKKIGECVISTDISDISRSLSTIQIEKTGSILVIDKDGSVLAGTKEDATYDKNILSNINENQNAELTSNGLLYKWEKLRGFIRKCGQE